MNCGEEGCPACAQERPAVAALRRWVAQQAVVNERLGRALDRQVQRCLGVAGYVPKEDEDDS